MAQVVYFLRQMLVHDVSMHDLSILKIKHQNPSTTTNKEVQSPFQVKITIMPPDKNEFDKLQNLNKELEHEANLHGAIQTQIEPETTDDDIKLQQELDKKSISMCTVVSTLPFLESIETIHPYLFTDASQPKAEKNLVENIIEAHASDETSDEPNGGCGSLRQLATRIAGRTNVFEFEPHSNHDVVCTSVIHEPVPIKQVSFQ